MKKKATTVTISSKGQITLPKILREKYHLTEGEEAIILPAREGILIKHRELSLRGILAGKVQTDRFEEDLRKLRREWTL
ncbi:MAG: AbrB/MazE/SpoVT family DNA-binding domain-containing protein [Thermoplasmata archaeon]